MLNGQQAQGNSFGKGEKVAGYYTQTMVVQELVAQALETATVDGKAINQSKDAAVCSSDDVLRGD